MKKKISLRQLAVITASITFFSSCYYDKADLLYPGSNAAVDCNTVAASFATNVRPIIDNNCATGGCHDNSAAGGVALTSYTEIKNAATRITARAINEKTMPTSGPLSAADIAVLKCWIDGGTLNN
jgi:uncharacterized membrane protein